jgi:hypothetical protein
MAVSVDKVYQTVLALANKEQRGYITPQEFNLFANHAQMDIFEQYFYDLNQFTRAPRGNEYSTDPVTIIYDKLSNFTMFVPIAATNPISAGNKRYKLPNDFYRYIDCMSGTSSSDVMIEKLNKKDFFQVLRSPLTKPTVERPALYFDQEDTDLWVAGFKAFANSAESIINLSYYRKPKSVNWTYVNINEKAIHNPSAADKTDFELHDSEERNLTIKILKLAGINLVNQGLASAAQSEEIKNIQQEKL